MDSRDIWLKPCGTTAMSFPGWPVIVHLTSQGEVQREKMKEGRKYPTGKKGGEQPQSDTASDRLCVQDARQR